MAKTAETPSRVFEHTTAEQLEGNVVDGMSGLLGDDILSSDYDWRFGEWPGVNQTGLPEAYRNAGNTPGWKPAK
jgi:hypothetical protein